MEPIYNHFNSCGKEVPNQLSLLTVENNSFIEKISLSTDVCENVPLQLVIGD